MVAEKIRWDWEHLLVLQLNQLCADDSAREKAEELLLNVLWKIGAEDAARAYQMLRVDEWNDPDCAKCEDLKEEIEALREEVADCDNCKALRLELEKSEARLSRVAEAIR